VEDEPEEVSQPRPARRRRTPSREPSVASAADDNLDNPLLVQAVALLRREAQHFGHGAWRVVADPIDLSIDRLSNRVMRPAATHPPDWGAFTIRGSLNVVGTGFGSGDLVTGGPGGAGMRQSLASEMWSVLFPSLPLSGNRRRSRGSSDAVARIRDRAEAGPPVVLAAAGARPWKEEA